MGTRFEAALFGAGGMGEPELRAAGEAALDEIDTFHAAFSLFRKDSFLTFLNERAFEKPVRVDPDLFDLLILCREVFSASGGAFDPTIGPLMRCWGFRGEEPTVPDAGTLDRVRGHVGFDRVTLDPAARTVRFEKAGMCLDLGAVAKGFALDRAAEVLQEAGIESALVHGGTSTVLALGRMAFPVAIRDPRREGGALRVVRLENRALSVSAPHGRAFESGGELLGHVMDPATGAPARGASLAAVTARSAALADAWATALLSAGPSRFPALTAAAEGITGLVLWSDGEGDRLAVEGEETELFADPGAAPGTEENHDA